ncbi:MAG: VCBS repeat-containing protein, partial [Planctomycetales bacterium]|nr:VCBS repeat-containing protein [Planctomycetales bacterium]
MANHRKLRLSRRIEDLEQRRLLTALADLDNDGDLDVYARNAWFENVDGQGNFVEHELAVDHEPFMHLDLDGDQDLDLVALDYGREVSQYSWIENRNGEFDQVHAFPESLQRLDQSDTMDVGGDGDIDFVVVSGSQVRLFENTDGKGTFAVTQVIESPIAGRFDAGDIDADGDIDFTNAIDGKAQLHVNQGNGEFRTVVVHEEQPMEPEMIGEPYTVMTHLGLQDIDSDGLPDLMIARSVANIAPANASYIWLKNQANLQFSEGATLGGYFDDSWSLTDWNSDGILESYNQNGPFSGVYFGTSHIPPRGFEWICDLGDINQDGNVDAVECVAYDDHEVPWWIDGATHEIHVQHLPNTTPLQIGDANLDFRIDEFDLIQVGKSGRFGSEADWQTGDWTGGPGGTIDSPPSGDGIFDDNDLRLLADSGLYLTGPYAEGDPADNDLSPLRRRIANTDVLVSYSPETGELNLDTNGKLLTSLLIRSADSSFDTVQPDDWNGPFDRSTEDTLFRFDANGFQIGGLGPVLPQNLTWRSVHDRLKIDGSLAGGGPLGNVRLECVDCVHDVDRLQAEIRSDVRRIEFDLNADSVVDRGDVEYLITEFYGSSIGDSNWDGVFDSSDFVHVFQFAKYEDGIDGNATWAEGDWDGNDDFDSADLVFAFSSGDYRPQQPKPAPVFGDFSFAPPIQVTQDDLYAVISDDFDSDGDLDFVFDIRNGGQPVWIENRTSHGEFPAVALPLNTRVLDSGDFDRDGDVDLLIRVGETTLAWSENLNGEGAFSEPRVLEERLDWFTQGAFVEITGDGNVDVIVWSRYEIQWYANLGNQTMSAQPHLLRSVSALIEEENVFLVDLNSDGFDDIYAAFGETPHWFINVDGRLERREFRDRVAASVSRLVDLDADDDLDLFYLSRSESRNPPPTLLHWRENIGNGDFGRLRTAQSELTGVGLFNGVFEDFDGNGILDVLVWTVRNRSIDWLAGQGDGHFGPRVELIPQIQGTPLVG